MEHEQLLFYLQTLHQSLNIPIAYRSQSGELHNFHPFSAAPGDFDESSPEFIGKRLEGVLAQFPDRHLMLLLHERLVIVGIVARPEDGSYVLLGPIADVNATEDDIERYLFSSALSYETSKQLSDYLNGAKLWTPDSARRLLLNINLILNGEMLCDGDIALIKDRETDKRDRFYKKYYVSKAEKQDQSDPLVFQDFTNQLCYCVLTGDTASLLEMINRPNFFPPLSDLPETHKELRQMAYGSIYACESVALQSGIPPAILEPVKQYYIDRIEQSSTGFECQQLAMTAIVDFTRCVKEHLSEKTKDPVVCRATEYINQNLNSKLLAADIAEAIHVSQHYLFVKFKKETGKTLTEYINAEKIKRACYYIMYTESSFSEIATSLSFSSQSYFQSVFKKVMGQTPNTWKQQNKKKLR